MRNLQLLLLVDRVVRYASERCTRNSSPVSQYWVRINLRLVAFAKSLRSAWGLLIQKVLRRTCIHHVSFSTCNIITKLQKTYLSRAIVMCIHVMTSSIIVCVWCDDVREPGQVGASDDRRRAGAGAVRGRAGDRQAGRARRRLLHHHRGGCSSHVLACLLRHRVTERAA